MNVQYLTNENNEKVAIVLELKDWEEAEKKIQVYDTATSIRRGLLEVEKIESGEIIAKDINELLNEL